MIVKQSERGNYMVGIVLQYYAAAAEGDESG